MNETTRKRMEAMGCVMVDDAADWLGLTAAEREENALRDKLARALWRFRTARKWTQKDTAKLIGTTQSRYAEIEQGITASLDRMLTAYFAFGGTLSSLETNGKPYSEAETEERAQVTRPNRAKRTTTAKRTKPKASSKA